MSNDKKIFYQTIQKWNKKKTVKTFFELYHNGFTHYTIRENAIWRIYKIIKHTLTGKYKWCENELYKQYGRMLDE